MAYSSVTIPADGTTDTFTFSFKYLSLKHVVAYKNGILIPGATFPTASSVKLNTAVANGDTILIQRITPRDKLTVEMPNSGTFRGRDINAMALQTLYISQEVFDSLTVIMQVALDNTMDALGHRISNVLDPVNDQDAVTKKWALTAMASELAQAIAAKIAAVAAQVASETARDISVSAASTSTTQAGISTTQAGIATAKAVLTAADVVSTHADQVTVAADKSTVSSDKGIVAGYKAAVAADKAEVHTLLDGFVGSIPTAIVVGFTPVGNIASTNVQTALQELDADLTSGLAGKANVGAPATGFSILDTRAVVSVPNDVPVKTGLFEFKNVASVGNPPGSASVNFAHVLTTNGWSADGSGGWPAQISFGSSIAYRQGSSATTWGPWETLAKLSGNQTLTGGFEVGLKATNMSSGTFKPGKAQGPNMQLVLNNGAHTLAAPTGDMSTYVLEYHNGTTPGALTLSGFTKITGDTYSSTAGKMYAFYISKLAYTVTHLHIVEIM